MPTGSLGLEVVQRAQVLGRLRADSAVTYIVEVTKPKTDIHAVLDGGFAVRRQGACGVVDQPLVGPWPEIRSMTDQQVMDRLGGETKMRIPLTLDPKLPARVVVDWSKASSVQIGPLTLPKGKEGEARDVSVLGCAAPPKVVVDGKEIGTFALDAPVQLIAPDDRVCYETHDIVAGDAATIVNPPRTYAHQHGYALDVEPSSSLENATTTERTRDGKVPPRARTRIACAP